MSVYGASFVRGRPDREESFRATVGILRESNASWLAASPTNLVVEHQVRASPMSDWLSIENAVSDRELETLSRTLDATAVTLYLVDEKSPQFLYRRLEGGRPIRVLESDGERWTRVEGEAESWEALLFSPRRMEIYRRYAPDETRELGPEPRVVPGLTIPASDVSVLVEIVAALELPWDPVGNRFPPSQIEVIPGSPERTKAWLRQHQRPWWKFWARGSM